MSEFIKLEPIKLLIPEEVALPEVPVDIEEARELLRTARGSLPASSGPMAQANRQKALMGQAEQRGRGLQGERRPGGLMEKINVRK
jgi:hypothetical protein